VNKALSSFCNRGGHDPNWYRTLKDHRFADFAKYYLVFLRIVFSQPQPTKKIPEPINTSRDVETRKQTVHTTLIRDQNGLGFTISGGKGSPSYKDNSDVRKYLIIVQVLARSGHLGHYHSHDKVIVCIS
jgi:hypothetical protein